MTSKDIQNETDDEERIRLLNELQEYKDAHLYDDIEEEIAQTKREGMEEARLKAIRNSFKPSSAKTSYKKPFVKKNRTGDDYRIMALTKGVVMNDRFRKMMNDCLMIYLFLKANIIRGRLQQDPLKIYKNYYEKGFLAVSYTEDYLADAMGFSRYYVRKQLNKLHKAGIIKKDMIQTGKKKRNCVYILGTHQFIGREMKERFYINDFIEDDRK